MKKKFLCLILIVLLCPIVTLFSGCKKFDGYNLNNLSEDFYDIAESGKNISLIDDKLVFDYSNFSTLNNLIVTQKPYSELSQYNQVYENVLSFVFEYIEACSNNKATNSKSVRNSIGADFKTFKSAIYEVDDNVTSLGGIVNVAPNSQSSSCLYAYERLLKSYENLYEKAGRLSNTLIEFYFNNVLSNGNPNPFEMVEGDYVANHDLFEPDLFIGRFSARIKAQISNLSQCFAEMCVDSSIATKVVYDNGKLDLDRYNYSSLVSSVNKRISEQQAFLKANQNKKLFYNYVVKAYNLQTILSENVENFEFACGEIAYLSLDKSKASTNDELCYDVIKNYHDVVKEYNAVLVDILTLLGV